MVGKKSTVKTSDLPERVKKAINEISLHRQEIRIAAGASALLTFIPTAMFFKKNMEEGKIGAAAFFALEMPALVALLGIRSLKKHGPLFRKEYMNLYRALKEHAEDASIKNLLKEFPYIVVDSKGNLVGKKTRPKIGMLPVGRRRVASPKAGKSTVRKWKLGYLPTARKDRERKQKAKTPIKRKTRK